MAYKSIKLLIFDKNPTHFLLFTVIEYRLPYGFLFYFSEVSSKSIIFLLFE